MADQEIPHGHGKSYKKGISDGLLQRDEFADDFPATHAASYRLGIEEGEALRKDIAERVRD